MDRIILHGGGGHVKVVIDCLQESKRNVIALFDPKYQEGNLMGIPYKGAYDPGFEPTSNLIVTIGDNKVRKKAVSIAHHVFTNAIHPTAILSKYAKFGCGNMFCRGLSCKPIPESVIM